MTKLSSSRALYSRRKNNRIAHRNTKSFTKRRQLKQQIKVSLFQPTIPRYLITFNQFSSNKTFNNLIFLKNKFFKPFINSNNMFRTLLDKVRVKGQISTGSDSPLLRDRMPIVYEREAPQDEKGNLSYYNSGGRSLLVQIGGVTYRIKGVDPSGNLTKRVAESKENRMNDVRRANKIVQDQISEGTEDLRFREEKPFGPFTLEQAELEMEAFHPQNWVISRYHGGYGIFRVDHTSTRVTNTEEVIRELLKEEEETPKILHNFSIFPSRVFMASQQDKFLGTRKYKFNEILNMKEAIKVGAGLSLVMDGSKLIEVQRNVFLMGLTTLGTNQKIAPIPEEMFQRALE